MGNRAQVDHRSDRSVRCAGLPQVTVRGTEDRATAADIAGGAHAVRGDLRGRPAAGQRAEAGERVLCVRHRKSERNG